MYIRLASDVDAEGYGYQIFECGPLTGTIILAKTSTENICRLCIAYRTIPNGKTCRAAAKTGFRRAPRIHPTDDTSLARDKRDAGQQRSTVRAPAESFKSFVVASYFSPTVVYLGVVIISAHTRRHRSGVRRSETTRPPERCPNSPRAIISRTQQRSDGRTGRNFPPRGCSRA